MEEQRILVDKINIDNIQLFLYPQMSFISRQFKLEIMLNGFIAIQRTISEKKCTLKIINVAVILRRAKVQ